jgi:hypothetical protein
MTVLETRGLCAQGILVLLITQVKASFFWVWLKLGRE